MGIRRGDWVRISDGSEDDGRVGRVDGIAPWYGKTMLMVVFDEARWDETEGAWYDAAEVEMPDTPILRPS